MRHWFLKQLIIVLLLVWQLNFIQAQNPIPNAGFENWSGSTPINWTSSSIPGFENITKSTDAYSGNFAVRGEVIGIGGFPNPPILYTGSQTQQTFPLSERFSKFSGQYKFSPQDGDMLYIEIAFINLSVGGGAEGRATIAAGTTSFQELDIVMEYDENNPPNWQPDHGSISITILPPENQTPHIGTWFIIDNFTFDNYPVDVKEIDGGIQNKFTLEQNYPNPFNPTTNIKFTIPDFSYANLKIYNILGEQVAELVNNKLPAGKYNVTWDAANMASGAYIYILKTEVNYQMGKMILMK